MPVVDEQNGHHALRRSSRINKGREASGKLQDQPSGAIELFDPEQSSGAIKPFHPEQPSGAIEPFDPMQEPPDDPLSLFSTLEFSKRSRRDSSASSEYQPRKRQTRKRVLRTDRKVAKKQLKVPFKFRGEASKAKLASILGNPTAKKKMHNSALCFGENHAIHKSPDLPKLITLPQTTSDKPVIQPDAQQQKQPSEEANGQHATTHGGNFYNGNGNKTHQSAKKGLRVPISASYSCTAPALI